MYRFIYQVIRNVNIYLNHNQFEYTPLKAQEVITLKNLGAS